MAISLGAGGVGLVTATDPPDANDVYVPLTPCRLADTRVQAAVGPRNTPLGAGETHTFAVRGDNGQCTIPADASAIVANVTALSPTAASFLTMWPADEPRPNASSLNYTAGQAPTPNGVTVALSADGAIRAYNESGTVDLLIDITGYYRDHEHDDRYYTEDEIDQLAIGGSPGPAGADGADGADAPRPARVVWVAESGGDHTTVQAALDAIGTTLPAATEQQPYVVKIAPGTYAGPVVMEDHVDIEGSGRSVTTLSGSGSDTSIDSDDSSAIVRVSGDIRAELRGLTIASIGEAGHQTGIATTGASTDLRLTDLTVIARFTGPFAGITSGVANESSTPTMSDVTIRSSGGIDGRGVRNSSGASATITHSDVGGAGTAVGFSVSNEGGSTADITHTQLIGSVTGGGFRCVGAYDFDYVELSDECGVANGT